MRWFVVRVAFLGRVFPFLPCFPAACLLARCGWLLARFFPLVAPLRCGPPLRPCGSLVRSCALWRSVAVFPVSVRCSFVAFFSLFSCFFSSFALAVSVFFCILALRLGVRFSPFALWFFCCFFFVVYVLFSCVAFGCFLFSCFSFCVWFFGFSFLCSSCWLVVCRCFRCSCFRFCFCWLCVWS